MGVTDIANSRDLSFAAFASSPLMVVLLSGASSWTRAFLLGPNGSFIPRWGRPTSGIPPPFSPPIQESCTELLPPAEAGPDRGIAAFMLQSTRASLPGAFKPSPSAGFSPQSPKRSQPFDSWRRGAPSASSHSCLHRSFGRTAQCFSQAGSERWAFMWQNGSRRVGSSTWCSPAVAGLKRPERKSSIGSNWRSSARVSPSPRRTSRTKKRSPPYFPPFPKKSPSAGVVQCRGRPRRWSLNFPERRDALPASWPR